MTAASGFQPFYFNPRLFFLLSVNVAGLQPSMILFLVALARNLQLMEQKPAKVCQGGDPMSLVKMKKREQTGRAQLLLLLEGDLDFQEDDISTSSGIFNCLQWRTLLLSPQLHHNVTILCFKGKVYAIIISCRPRCSFECHQGC
jgi:hypothetical protein